MAYFLGHPVQQHCCNNRAVRHHKHAEIISATAVKKCRNSVKIWPSRHHISQSGFFRHGLVKKPTCRRFGIRVSRTVRFSRLKIHPENLRDKYPPD